MSNDAYRLNALEVYGRLGIAGVALSPDGRTLAYTHVRERRAEEDKEGKRIKVTTLGDVFLLPAAGGFPQQLTNSGDVAQAPVWSPDGQRLLVQRQGQLQSISADPAAGAAKPVVLHKGGLFAPNLPGGDAPFGAPRWSPDGTWVLTATRDGHETTLVLLGADGRQTRQLLTVEGYLTAWDWSPDGRTIVVVTRHEDAHTGDVRLVDTQSGAARVLWEERAYAYREPVATFLPHASGTRLLFRSNRSGWSKLYIAAADGSDVRALTTGKWDDDAFRVSPDGAQVVFASRAAQTGTQDDLWVVSAQGGEARRLTTVGGVNYPIGWAGEDVLFWHATPADPGDVWSARSGKRVTSSAPLELTRKLPTPTEVSFTSGDGTRISALLYLPAYHQEGNRYPPIVWIRGGPTAVSRYTFSGQPAWLANEGFAVITLNYRGSTGHGVPFMEAVAAEGVGKLDLEDVLAAAEHVKTLPCANLTRGVGVGGHSWGGYLTLMAATKAPEVFSCAVAGAAIADWTVQQAKTEVRWYDRWLVGGWLYEREAHARDRSPITHAEQLKTPLLVMHGEQDTDVPFAQIGPFVDRAKKSGAPVEYITFPNEGHGNRLPKNQQRYLDQARRWFRRYLQPWDFRENPTGDQVA